MADVQLESIPTSMMTPDVWHNTVLKRIDHVETYQDLTCTYTLTSGMLSTLLGHHFCWIDGRLVGSSFPGYVGVA